QGAIHLSTDDIEKQLSQFPKDREIIVYCSCPNEVSSARLALRLQRKGFTRVRPLQGGIDAWRERNYPVEVRNGRLTGSRDPVGELPQSSRGGTAGNPALDPTLPSKPRSSPAAN